jgi:hypothetical protein
MQQQLIPFPDASALGEIGAKMHESAKLRSMARSTLATPPGWL